MGNCLPALFYIICGYAGEHSFTLIISSNVNPYSITFVIGGNYQVKFRLPEDYQLKSIIY